jgi:hypothetical protein
MDGNPANQALTPNRDKFGVLMLSLDDKRCSIGKVSARIASFLLFFLFHSSGCWGQDKLVSFFDPDETNQRESQVIEALKLICPESHVLRDQQGSVAGCQYCPRETGFADEKTLDWDLKRAFTGHFTSASEENIVLSGRGCESHSENFGGTFIFAVQDSVVRLLHYDEALITETCHKFDVRGAPDMLVCMDDWGAQVRLFSYLYQVEFDEDGGSKVTHIFETVDLSRQKCGLDFYDGRPTFIQESHITELNLTNRKGRPLTLSATASLGNKNPTEKERKACEQGEPILLPLNLYQLVFLFNGSTFRPTPKSRETLKLFPKPELPKDSYSPNH